MTKSIVALACGMSASAGGHAWAQQQAPESLSESLPVCQLDPRDSSKLAVEPCRPAPPVQPRRSVAQVIGRMPAQSVPPVVPMAPLPPLPPSPAVPMPRAPQPIGACDTGGCRDSAGARYNGAGNATLDANGRICHRNGAFIQCF
ncbi:hypothetical protein [Janthinobacterium lividum]|uniref:Uncharacterized protein n=1 Tax=Janthinobacterium lividum TaxID=29581 RepID=A0ABU0XWC8_9BURK|nr:hypothetical protein [Janthinobacterium lividum]MDQ4627708.1 hypothetical protein [Janthinobacterium lividum]MDQ4676526.1 hypothetical protein [Janthinobacterium lividum]MDQ4687002.1 hypothetical protein [Janthinobacterium lividum]